MKIEASNPLDVAAPNAEGTKNKGEKCADFLAMLLNAAGLGMNTFEPDISLLYPDNCCGSVVGGLEEGMPGASLNKGTTDSGKANGIFTMVWPVAAFDSNPAEAQEHIIKEFFPAGNADGKSMPALGTMGKFPLEGDLGQSGNAVMTLKYPEILVPGAGYNKTLPPSYRFGHIDSGPVIVDAGIDVFAKPDHLVLATPNMPMKQAPPVTGQLNTSYFTVEMDGVILNQDGAESFKPVDVSPTSMEKPYQYQIPAKIEISSLPAGNEKIATAEIGAGAGVQENIPKETAQGTSKTQQVSAGAGMAEGNTGPVQETSYTSGHPKAFSSPDSVPVKNMPQVLARAAVQMINWPEQRDNPVATVIRLKLEPRHLGEMTVRLTCNRGELTAHFYTSSVPARDAVEGTLPQLREVLAQQNIQLNDAAAFVGRENSQQQGQGGYRHNNGSFRQLFNSAEPVMTPDERSSNSWSRNGGLNLLV